MLWSELTWEEIPEVLKAVNYSAILPVGATEQHGPHLGCGVDSVIADIVCKEVSKRTKVPMLPTLPYGCSIGHSKHWPGTIAIQPITLIEFVKQIGDWAYAGGVRRLFIVNAHVTNSAPLRCTLEMLRASYDDLMVSIIHTASISTRVKEFHFSDAEDWHANDAETSVIMARTPELFRADKLDVADDPDRTENLIFAHPVNHTSKNGVTGYPSRASIEKGKQGFEWMVEDLCRVILKGSQEEPPLDTPYCCKH